MKCYLAYIRVSTVKQGEHGSSLQEQKAAIEAYAAKHDLTISGWYEEVVTAAKIGRRMFNRLLTELEKGRAAGVIIHKIDRSARNLKDWAHLGELIDMGTEVHFAHESVDMTSRGGRLAADIQAVVAADYIRNLREEVRKGFYGRVRQGIYPLGAPRGYLDQGRAKVKAIDPMVGPLVRQAFELYATGAYSLPTLRMEMHGRGLHAAGGKPLSLDALSHVLHNPFYIGLIRIKRTGETFQGRHDPLVDAATFNRVQTLMAGRTYARPRRHEFLFRRLIRCASCGYALVGEVQKGTAYYRCHSATCRGTSVREADLSEDVQAFLDKLTVPEDDVRDFRDFVDANAQHEAEEAKRAQQQQKRNFDLCEGRLARLTDAYLDGTIEKDLFEQRKQGLLVERRALLDTLGASPSTSAGLALLKKLELGNTAQNILRSTFLSEIRDLLKTVTSNLEVLGKNLVITPQFPFADIIARMHPLASALDTGAYRTGVSLFPLAAANGRTLYLNLENATADQPEATNLDFLKRLADIDDAEPYPGQPVALAV